MTGEVDVTTVAGLRDRLFTLADASRLVAADVQADRIIAMSRHEPRQDLALEFGATDIVSERGDGGVAAIKELTGGLGAHSVIEAVSTQESMMQAVRSARRRQARP